MEAMRPKVGLLALTLELYERRSSDLRHGREAWVRGAVLPALKPFADVLFEDAVFRRADVERRVAQFEAEGVDALLVVLLSYSPSQIALPALVRTRLPIIVWNTQELPGVGPAFSGQDMSNNHGVHGTQDLANVLLRSGVPFEYVTSHLADDGATDAPADFFAAAAAVRRLRSARVGLLGYPFPGMGDFALDTTHMAATLGCEWANLPLPDCLARAQGANVDHVQALVADYRDGYDVEAEVTDADLEGAARMEVALRGMVADHRLDALTYQFLSFRDDERTPTLPFVAASRLMAEGIGFGGEGDLISAAAATFLNWLQPPASFSEIFTVDFGGNAVVLSHMGESNVAMARKDRKVPLAAKGRPADGAKCKQLVPVVCFEPGPATLFTLTLGPGGRWRVITAACSVADWGPVPGIKSPHSRLVPQGDVREFLTAYAKAGGPHHLAVCFGDARRRLALAARMLDADYFEV